MPRSNEAKRSAAPPPLPKAFSLIGDAKLREFYAAMVKCRMLDDRLRHIHRQSKSRYISSAGHEAAIVGAAIDLRREDWLIPSHWASAASLIKGLPLATIFSSAGNSGLDPPTPVSETASKPANPQKIAPPIPSLPAQVDIAAGLALATKATGKGGVVLAFCESIPASSAHLQSTLRFIAQHRLPLLILMQRRNPSKRSPPEKKRPASLVIHAKTCGIPVIPVDRDDVVAMYRVAFESIHKARHDGGPTVIEAVAWLPPASHRAKEAEKSVDPILKMEAYLTSKGLFSTPWKQGLIDRFENEFQACSNTSRSKDI